MTVVNAKTEQDPRAANTEIEQRLTTLSAEIEQRVIELGFQFTWLGKGMIPVYRRKGAPRSEPSLTPPETYVVNSWETKPSDIEMANWVIRSVISLAYASTSESVHKTRHITLRTIELLGNAEGGWYAYAHISSIVGNVNFCHG